jgi:hypothetical protein
LHIGTSAVAIKTFGLSVLLLAGYPWVLAGHYDMYGRRYPRSMDYCPPQERIALGVLGLTVVAYLHVGLRPIASI